MPVYVTGSASHSWWAMVILLLVAGMLFASLVFAYLYLWTVSPKVWPGSAAALPPPGYALAAAAALIGSSAAIAFASKSLRSARAGITGSGHGRVRVALLFALGLLPAALCIELYGHWQSGLRPSASGYAAAVYMLSVLQGQLVLVLVVMGAFTLARSWTSRLDAERRVTFDNTMLLWHYTVAQGLVALLLTHGFPRTLV